MPFAELSALDHPERHSAMLDHLALLTEKHEVLVDEDIYDPHGNLLLQRGQRMTPHKVAGFAGRELYQPLERCLRVRDGIYTHLRERARSHIARDPLMQRLLPTLEIRHEVLSLIAEVRFNPALEWLLTCLDVTHPGALEHHIGVAVMCCVVGMQARMDQTELRKTVAAALFHDIGDLYIAPDPTGGKGELTLDRWGQMVRHPLISANILRQFALLPEDVVQAVAEHHERGNGGGYPFQVTKLSTLGHILSIAEALIGVLSGGGGSGQRAYMALHFERDEFDARIARLLTPFLTQLDTQIIPPVQADPLRLVTQLKGLSDLMAQATRMLDAQRPHPLTEEILEHTRQRMQRLNSTLNATGMNEPGLLFEQLLASSDPRMVMEMETTAREIVWRLRYLARSVSLDLRHTPPAQHRAFEPFLDLLAHTPDGRGGVFTST